MAITFVAESSNSGTASTSGKLKAPAGIVSGDILLVKVAVYHGAEAPTTPAGWTLITSYELEEKGGVDSTEAWYWMRWTTGTEWEWKWSTSANHQIECLAYRGCVATGSPIDAATVENHKKITGNKATHPGITLAHPNEVVVAAASNDQGFNWKALGSPWTPRASEEDEILEERAFTAAGATGAVNFEATGSATEGGYGVMVLGLIPSGARNIERLEPTAQFDGGVIIPSGAAANKVLTSTAAGEGFWSSVLAAMLGSEVVETAKIKLLAITTALLALGAVTPEKTSQASIPKPSASVNTQEVGTPGVVRKVVVAFTGNGTETKVKIVHGLGSLSTIAFAQLAATKLPGEQPTTALGKWVEESSTQGTFTFTTAPASKAEVFITVIG